MHFAFSLPESEVQSLEPVVWGCEVVVAEAEVVKDSFEVVDGSAGASVEVSAVVASVEE